MQLLDVCVIAGLAPLSRHAKALLPMLALLQTRGAPRKAYNFLEKPFLLSSAAVANDGHKIHVDTETLMSTHACRHTPLRWIS